MINWLKNIFKKNELLKGAAENRYYIEKYKDFDKIIATMYQVADSSGKNVNIDGVVTPLKIDNRQLCSVPNNQGQTPHCAGYSICNIIEALLWKKTGKLIELNADQVYSKAKQFDGDISTDGTYLECAIKAAIELGGFGKQSKNIKIGFLYNSKNDLTLQQMKRLIHKYDFLHVGFMIDDAWYKANNKDYIIKKGSVNLGGHALVACGYDQVGLYIQNSWGISWGSKSFAIEPWNIVKDTLLYCCYIQNFNVDD